MDLLTTQIVCIAIIVVVSFSIGTIPIFIGSRFNLAESGKASRKAQILAFLMNFGGGVLFGLSLCHWLPETREGTKISANIIVTLQI